MWYWWVSTYPWQEGGRETTYMDGLRRDTPIGDLDSALISKHKDLIEVILKTMYHTD